ncbi:MAG: cyclodeaminase/cyclohydrolase family protein [Anaerolineae bacterium]
MATDTIVDTQFLDALATSDPTPGGGSASAYAGALAAGLVSMVCRLTVGQKRFAAVQADMETLLQRSEALRASLTSLTEADMAAYSLFAQAQRLPRSGEAEKEERNRQMQAALRQCTLVPQRIAAACRELLLLCPDVVAKGNPAAISDGAVAALLAEAALRGAALQVVVNLAWLKDPAFVSEQRLLLAAVAEGVSDLKEGVVADVERALQA